MALVRGGGMHKLKVWYLVMNSNRARILRGLPVPHEAAGPEIVLQSVHRKLRDALEDRPTRSFSSGSPGRRSGVEPSSDPMREDELRFLRDVFAFLWSEHEAHAFEDLVVIAPPETLGLLRDEIPDKLGALVRQEVPRNLMRLSAAELAAAIRVHLEDAGIHFHAGQPIGWTQAGTS